MKDPTFLSRTSSLEPSDENFDCASGVASGATYVADHASATTLTTLSATNAK